MKLLKLFSLLTVMLSFSSFAKSQNPVNFTLPSATDTSHFTLRNANGRFIALHFLLKTECPYCLRYTHEYFVKAKTLPDVVQVFIKPDTESEIKEWANKLDVTDKIEYSIYRDEDAKLATQYGIPGGYAFHEQTVHYPALILLNSDGKEVFRYIGKNNSDRFSFENLVTKINELSLINKK